MEGLIFLFVVVVAFVAFVRGATRAFQRNWIAALLVLLVFWPAFVFWAFIELFTTGPIKQFALPVRVVNEKDIDDL